MAVAVRLRPVSLEEIRTKVVKDRCGWRDWTDTEWVGGLTEKYECNENSDSEPAGEQQRKQQLHFLRSEGKKRQERRESEDTARDWGPKLALQRRRIAYLRAEQPWDHGPASLVEAYGS